MFKDKESPVRLALALIAAGGLLMATLPAFAGHPLVSDDTGTQGKGKVQVEIGSAFWHHKEDRDPAQTVQIEGGELAPVVTVGLSDEVDLVVASPYLWWSEETNSVRTARGNGMGDTGLDVKWRFFQAQGWSLALKPGVSFPSGNEDEGVGCGRTTYRAFLIVSRELAPLTIHLNLGYIRNNNNTGHHQDLWRASIAAEYEILKDLHLMADLGVGRCPLPCNDSHPTFLLGGLAYRLSDHVRVDGGVKFGLNKSETDWTYLLGLTFNF